jgi:hypothetical protein
MPLSQLQNPKIAFMKPEIFGFRQSEPLRYCPTKECIAMDNEDEPSDKWHTLD